MELFNVTYETWKTVFTNHSSSWAAYQYVVQEDERKVWTGTQDYIYHCVVDSNNYADYSGSIESVATEVSSSDDAKALIVGLTGIPVGRSPEGLPVFSLDAEQSDKAVRVTPVGRIGTELVIASHNFADKTTWFSNSTPVVSGTLSNSGDNLTFSSSNPCWVDMTHGKVLEEDVHDPTYFITVRVDGAEQEQTNRAWDETEKDYFVNYESGSITFHNVVTGTVDADFHYADSSRFVVGPAVGKTWSIEDAEGQFTQDVIMETGLIFEFEGYADVFAPHLLTTADPPGPLPPGTHIGLGAKYYKTFYQIIDDAYGSYPEIPQISGGRGTGAPIFGFPFRYGTVRDLIGAYGMRLVVKLQDDDKPFGGSRTTATFYCLEQGS